MRRLIWIVVLTWSIAAQTRINYNTQVRRAPQFPGFGSAQVQPDGPIVYWPQGIIRFRTIFDESAIRPAECQGAEVPFEIRNTAAPSIIFGPDHVFFCVPRPDGTGFRLVRASFEKAW